MCDPTSGEDLLEHIDALTASLRCVTSTCDLLQRQLKEARSPEEMLRRELLHMHQTIEQIGTVALQLKDKNALVTAQLKTAILERDCLRRELAEARADAEREAAHYEDQLDQLSAYVGRIEISGNETGMSQIADLEKELLECQCRNRDLEADIAGLRHRLEDEAAERRKRFRENDDLRERLNESETRLEECTFRIADLESENQELKEASGVLLSDYPDLLEQYEQLMDRCSNFYVGDAANFTKIESTGCAVGSPEDWERLGQRKATWEEVQGRFDRVLSPVKASDEQSFSPTRSLLMDTGLEEEDM
jgi:chromosome segregation ATPase